MSDAQRDKDVEFDPLVGRVIGGRYRVVQRLARGGMGTVYVAYQENLARQVAMKVLRSGFPGERDPDFQRRFMLEAETCAKLTHPNTVTIFDYGIDNGIYYTVMELVSGQTLRQVLREDGPLDLSRALHIARQICRSLREAHSLGVIHRDLKPANVMLVSHGDETDFVKVLDFGLVKYLGVRVDAVETKTGLFMGSPSYMAPEQIRNETVDHRVDVYALGIVLFEMLTGRPPYTGKNELDILNAHVSQPVPRMHDVNRSVVVPHEVEQIVRIALAKIPSERFEDMGVMLTALHSMSSGVSGTMSPSYPSSGRWSAPVALDVTSETVTETPSVLKGRRPGRRGRYIAAAIVLCLGLTAAALAATGIVEVPWGRSHHARTARAARTPAERVPTPIAAAPRAPAPPPATPRVVVSVRSRPTGAMVRAGDREYGPTPIEFELAGEQARAGREVTFVIHKAGFRDFPVIRNLTEGRIELFVVLDRAAPQRRSGGARGGGESLSGFRESPY